MISIHLSIPTLTACGFMTLLTGCASNDSFAKLDTNHDAAGSPAEFDTYMKKEVFARVDTDNDGKVTKVEWQQFNPKVSDARFRKTDTNSNGSISHKEADAAFDREESLMKLFKIIDSDHSGNLSQPEVTDFHAKLQQQPGSSPAEKITNAVKQP